MKRYILIFTLTIAILISISVTWFSYNQTDAFRSELKTTLNAVKISGINMDYDEFADKIGLEDSKLRVTILDDIGNVLADNKANKTTMSNHSNRKEFIEAKKNGYGEEIRMSETTGARSIYVALKLTDGIYVRLAKPVSLTAEFLLWLFIPLLFLSLFLAVFLFIYARNKQTERLRTEFIANVSHELKTPLTSIKGFAELIAAGLETNINIIIDYQHKIITQSDRLILMINDILELSKLETIKPKNIIYVDLNVAAEQVKENLKQFADEKGIIVQIIGKGNIKAENDVIYNLLYNLVDNAIKYGKNGGYVNVILENNKIIVKDNGIGISKENHSRIFERFYRVDKSRNKQTGGTGLGLAIVKHAALRYGGKITLNSESGYGTEIKIEFKT